MMYEEGTGQLSFLPISTNTNNYIVQSNSLIAARQKLSLNAARLIRVIMMQIVDSDMEFKPFYITPPELANMIGCDVVNIYHKAKDICDEIVKKPIEIRNENGSWVIIPWVQKCSYNKENYTFEIKLNDELKPYLLNLVQTGYYTQYNLGYALSFNSVYALRVFELIQSKIMVKNIPRTGVYVDITIDELREACMLYKKNSITREYTKEELYTKVSQLKEKVLDIAVKEIEKYTTYIVSYDSLKKGRSIVAFRFHVNMCYNRKSATE